MTIAKVELVLKHSRARGTEKLILVGIADHDGDGGAWPTIATLARYANCTERTVQRSIENLVAAGELRVHLNEGGTLNWRSDRRPNRYEILVTERPWIAPQERGDTDVTPSDSSPRGDAGVVHGVTPVTPRGDASVTQTVQEPYKEPATPPAPPSSSMTSSSPPPSSPSSGGFPVRPDRARERWMPSDPAIVAVKREHPPLAKSEYLDALHEHFLASGKPHTDRHWRDHITDQAVITAVFTAMTEGN